MIRPRSLTIPIIARDFPSYSPNSNPPTGHPDFGHSCCDDSLQKGKGVLGRRSGPIASRSGLVRLKIRFGTDAEPVHGQEGIRSVVSRRQRRQHDLL
jgi:hypothetical protein